MSTKRIQPVVYLSVLHVVTFLVMGVFLKGHALFSTLCSFLFLVCGLVSGSMLLSLPAVLPALLCLNGKLWGRKWYRIVTYILCALVAFAVHLFLISDIVVLTMFGYHINGLVVNLFLTPGGVESMGLQTGNLVFIALSSILLFAVELLLVWLAFNWSVAERIGTWIHRRWKLVLVWPVAVVVCFLVAIFCEGIADFKADAASLVNMDAYPLFPQVRMRKMLRRFGMKEPERENAVSIASSNAKMTSLCYPVAQVVRKEHAKYNIVWLVGESLRNDMLTEEIMPRTWQLASRGWRFTQHYSGGHGTRPAMFSMFYSLHGNCWDSFLDRSRCPLLFDWLHEDGYSFLCQTSAKFSYPEFNRTIFASMKDAELREYPKGIAWQRDMTNIDNAIAFVRQHDENSPFFVFCFFESTHAPYSFPEEGALRDDYAKNVNYATIRKSDAPTLKNRYINAAHHVDAQIGKLLDALAEKPAVAAKTIVVVTGDHGEEFFEKGRLGHNSTFVQEQIRTPLVIYAPDVEPAVYDKMSHHTDIVPTIAPLLGVTNPPSDFGVGGNLFSPDYTRTGFLCFGWDVAVFATQNRKYLLPMGKKQAFALTRLTTLDDEPCDDKEFLKNNAAKLHQAQQEMFRFLKTARK
ncbi:MAG: sulfatase-like hydrolase/transferase [Victivallales bacterium]|nr:sulfatase-like hydrolase/transferase [Victivallales bacterium]